MIFIRTPEDHIKALEDCLDAIIRVLNIRFGIGWIESEFDTSNYEACDSINAVEDIAQIIRDASQFRIQKEAEG